MEMRNTFIVLRLILLTSSGVFSEGQSSITTSYFTGNDEDLKNTPTTETEGTSTELADNETEPFCASSPCKNGGVCMEETRDCICPYDFNYLGNCEVTENCSPNPCQNNGTCTPRRGNPDYKCICRAGFGGQDCDEILSSTTIIKKTFLQDITQEPEDSCSSNPCKNGGTCVLKKDNFTCICPDDFEYNNNCEVTVSCDPNPCENNGTCIPLPGRERFKCDCSDGFYGDTCATDPTTAASTKNYPPLNTEFNSTLLIETSSEQFNSPQESTTAPSTEVTSETSSSTQKDPCSSNPCKNGGTCIPKEDSFACICPDNFEYIDNCEVTVNCDPNPCENNGTCIPLPGRERFKCDCSDGFYGDTCATDNPCDATPPPCENDGVCEVTNGTASCTCRNPYFGEKCELSPCTSEPCKNRGTCEITVDKNFTCTCEKPYRGTTCEQSPCDSNPCLNNGSCRVGDHDFECLCRKPYKGKNCEMDPTTASTNTSTSPSISTDPVTKAPTKTSSEEPASYPDATTAQPTDATSENTSNPTTASTNKSMSPSVITDPVTKTPTKTSSEESTSYPDATTAQPADATSENIPNPTTASRKTSPSSPIITDPVTEKVTETSSEQSSSTPDSTPALPTNATSDTNTSPPKPTTVSTKRTTSAPNTTDSTSTVSAQTNSEQFTSRQDSTTALSTDATSKTSSSRPSPCDSNPCLNNGSCRVGDHDFECLCRKPYAGKTCEKDDLCFSNPCKNGGTCISMKDSFTCICPDEFLYKNNCEDPCFLNPCSRNMTCEPVGESFKCVCLPGEICGESLGADDGEDIIMYASGGVGLLILVTLVIAGLAYYKRVRTKKRENIFQDIETSSSESVSSATILA